MAQNYHNQNGVVLQDSAMYRQAVKSTAGDVDQTLPPVDQMAADIHAIVGEHNNGKDWTLKRYVFTLAGQVSEPLIVGHNVSRLVLQATGAAVSMWLDYNAIGNPHFVLDPAAQQIILPGNGQPMTMVFQAAGAGNLTVYALAFGG